MSTEPDTDRRTGEDARSRWAERVERAPSRKETFTTVSGRTVEPLYGPEDLDGPDPAERLGYPGQFPFARGIHANLHRGRLWTMRQFAGFGTPERTNQRFRFLLEKGQTGLSIAFDLPTLMGLDSDAPGAAGEVGRLGVSVDTVEDVHELFAGIDPAAVSTSMTINAPAAMLMAFYLVMAEERGVEWDRLRGTIQNDILKEFHAQNEVVFPPEPSTELAVDVIEHCARHAPLWNPVSISGYHIREAGSTAGQELAYTLADGFEYVRRMRQRGWATDGFAPRLSFFFNAHNEFFEEIAKYRAARRIWARHLRDQHGAATERAQRLRFHAQTAGCTLQAQQPEVNLIRVAYQAMAAALGGCQSLHTNSMDETLSLPTEHAVTLALRTQQVLAHETGVASTVDPLGGSYYVEKLTDELEAEAEGLFRRIDEHGGVVPAVEAGFFRRRIAEASSRYQREVESGDRIVVGVNAFEESGEAPIEIHRVDPALEPHQKDRLRRVKDRRDGAEVERRLKGVREAAVAGGNVMPAIVEAARSRATVGEMMNALAAVYGRYRPGQGW
jgi:methylmalonyl-CoA mutase N-terminal domain/subunit